MEATFVLNEQEDRTLFVDRLTNFFSGKTIRVRVEEIDDKAVSQHHLLKRIESLRLLTEQIPVTFSPGIDINDIIDEVNGNGF